LDGTAAEDGQYFALLEETPVALVEAQAGQVRVVRGFNL
jgi:tRNA pseudouridine55 synthase